MSLTRRHLAISLPAALAGTALRAGRASAAPAAEVPAAIAALGPHTEGLSPISRAEHEARLAKAQRLLVPAGLDALVVGAGSSLRYFTGADWWASERFLGMILTRSGPPAWVLPSFERDRALEQISAGADIRMWEEDQSPFALVARVLRDRGVATGRTGMDEGVPFAFTREIAAAVPAVTFVSGAPVIDPCRMVKDAHEVALIRRACEITVRAHRAVLASLREGTTVAQASAWSEEAHRRQGAEGGSLVLFGPDAALPHGTTTPKALRPGDVVLVDGGCRLHGYRSDVTRTAVFGAPPTDRQRLVWELVHKAQRAAADAVRPGAACQAPDAAARRVVDEGGFGPGYRYFSHRLGHGIGLDGHEAPYLVRGNATRIEPGMTFTLEPGIYVKGELGVRHEDTVVATEDGCRTLCPSWSLSPTDPTGA